jgi:hypothetical protein
VCDEGGCAVTCLWLRVRLIGRHLQQKHRLLRTTSSVWFSQLCIEAETRMGKYLYKRRRYIHKRSRQKQERSLESCSRDRLKLVKEALCQSESCHCKLMVALAVFTSLLQRTPVQHGTQFRQHLRAQHRAKTMRS